MMVRNRYSRRKFLKISSLAAIGLLVPGLMGGCSFSRKSILPVESDWRLWPLERKLAQMLLLGFPG